MLVCGACGSALFVIVFLLEGCFRSNYKSLEHPISSLAIGNDAWIQQLNFILTGISITLFAFGLRKSIKPSFGAFAGPLLIGMAGIGLIGAGICSTDPIYGYPMDMPLRLAQYTIRGKLHDFFSIFLFLGLPFTCFIYRKHFLSLGKKQWARYSTATAVGIFLFFILAGLGFKQAVPLVYFAGLFQRISVIIGCIWIIMLGIHFIRQPEII